MHGDANRSQQVAQIIAGGFDQNNIRLRCNGMRPFDVERCFHGPLGIGGGLSGRGVYLAEAAVV